jgi:hypothetical protein
MVITNDMLPSRQWHIKDGKLTYRPFQETVFECSTTLKVEKTWARTISFPLSLLASWTVYLNLPNYLSLKARMILSRTWSGIQA